MQIVEIFSTLTLKKYKQASSALVTDNFNILKN